MYNNSNALAKEDPDLVDDLIENGGKSIRNVYVLEEYISLANRWWKFKNKISI